MKRAIFHILTLLLPFTLLAQEGTRLSISSDKGLDLAPSISEDGKTLIFASDRSGKIQFYESKKKGDKWSEPFALGAINNFENISTPSVSHDGKMILFAAVNKEDAKKGTDLYYVTKYGRRLGKVTRLNDAVNSNGYEMYPSLSPDGQSLYFSRLDPDSDMLYQSYSIYVSVKDIDGNWQEPTKLPAPVNVQSEKAPKMLADGKTLLFTAEIDEDNAEYDIFASIKKENKTWGDPKSLDFLNDIKSESCPAINFKNNIVIYEFDNDLYQMELPDDALPYEKQVLLANNTRNTHSSNKGNSRTITESESEDAWDMGDLDFDVKEFVKKSQYYALIIGVNEYKDSKIKTLEKPIQDATEIKNILTSMYNFKEENVTFLANPVRSDIIDAFDVLSNKVTSEDNLLIFYAGHGHWDAKKKAGYWLPSDSQKKSTANWFRNSTLKEYIGGVKAKHTLLISDACFSGSIFRKSTRAAFEDASKAINKLYELPSRKAMTSGTLKEVPDESVFIKYLFKRLKDNGDKYLSAGELFNSFKIAVMNNSDNAPQYGVIADSGDEGGDFIFIKKQ